MIIFARDVTDFVTKIKEKKNEQEQLAVAVYDPLHFAIQGKQNCKTGAVTQKLVREKLRFSFEKKINGIF